MLARDTIRIGAPLSVVWDVTTDVERWPEWTPTVTSVVRDDDGPFGLGSVARIKQPGQPEAEWTVTEFVPEERFVWESRRPGLKFRGAHNLAAEGPETISVLEVEAAGLLAALLSPVLRFAIRRALSEENRGLKKRCEEITRTEKSP